MWSITLPGIKVRVTENVISQTLPEDLSDICFLPLRSFPWWLWPFKDSGLTIICIYEYEAQDLIYLYGLLYSELKDLSLLFQLEGW